MRVLGAIVVLLLLAAATYFFVFNKSNTTFEKNKTSFAVGQIDKINRIVIQDEEKYVADLRKIGDRRWSINKRYYVREDAINNLLQTIKRTRVHAPVPNAAYDNVMKSMRERSRKVDIYVEDELHKSFYISGNTNDKMGTYMMLEGSDQPYITKMQGHKGYIHRRFFTNMEEWRTREAFDFAPFELKSIKMQYAQKPEDSFELTYSGKNAYTIRPLNAATLQDDSFNKLLAAEYMNAFQSINVEAFHNHYTLKDSILAEPVICHMRLEGKNGEVKELTVYPMFNNERSKTMFDKEGNRLRYDLDHYHALMNDGRDFAIIQDYIFGPRFKKYSDFFTSTPIEAGVGE